MLPRQPPRRPQLGFLYVPPYRVQGISVAGEETSVHIPELDLCFDLGLCPRAMLSSKFVALSHGHMDHAAGLSYYYSQRYFQGMGAGTVVCHPAIEKPIHNIMSAWVDLEAQKTPYNVVPLQPDEELEIKNHIMLRAIATLHTVPSLGFVVVEKRSKLKPQYAELPQEKLVELKQKGEEITQQLQIPLICYTGDTMWGPHFDRPDVLQSKVLITECTFLEPEHRGRAKIGQHLHLDDIVTLLGKSKAEAVVLTHLSRRTHMGMARRQIQDGIPAHEMERVFVLMDSRTNRGRLQQQQEVAEREQAQLSAGRD